MFMGGLIPDTVASLVVMTLLAGVHPCAGDGMTRSVFPALYQTSGGQTVTLTCARGPRRGGFISVPWYRNGVEIFQTSIDDPTVILYPLTTSPEYQSVSGRISVSSSLQQHNVTLRTNSTLDQGSVWRCQSGKQFSNNITVDFKESIQDTSRAEGGSSPGPKSTRDSTMFATEGQHTGASSPGPESTKESTTLAPEGQHTGPTSTDDKDMITTSQTTASTRTPFIHTAEFIYVVAGSAGGVVIVVFIVIVVFLCIRSRREDKADKDNCKEDEESERETIVMEDNDLYHGFVRTENQESTEEQQVADVYAKVNKIRKTHNATEVQITLSIEDLYAKPNKPASRKSEAASKVSSNQNEDVNTPD